MILPSAAVALALIMLTALTLYALLGGADYGAGVLDLCARGPREKAQRELIAHAIGPVWEVNHIWLILVVVLLFTAFPAAFQDLMTTMHVPLTFMLIGIVLRGSAFTFRAYDNSARGDQRWNHAFSIPSVLTPVFLGIIVGAIAMGHGTMESNVATHLWSRWLSPFPIAVGFFTLTIFTYLASVYLTLETDSPALRDDFRLRALISAILLGAIAWAVYLLAAREAPQLYEALNNSRLCFAIRIITGCFAVTALIALWIRKFALARVAAILQVVLILWGCALAQAPYLVPPRWTFTNSAAPLATLRILLIALALGFVFLTPSLVILFRIFKAHTLNEGKSDHPSIEH